MEALTLRTQLSVLTLRSVVTGDNLACKKKEGGGGGGDVIGFEYVPTRKGN